MKKIKYVCSHCGRKFESEKSENLECPGCFWSTTVHPDTGSQAAENIKDNIYTPPSTKREPSKYLLVGIMGVCILLGLLFAWLIFREPAPKKSNSKSGNKVSIPAVIQDEENPEEVDTRPPLERLSDSEKETLYKELNLPEMHALTDKEKKILSEQAEYKTGMVERLPSQIWSIDQFKKLIEDQEKAYKVPLPRSYKKKLVKAFELNYLASQEPFEKGELYKARDAWISGLIFPIYGNDIQKHRGVVLTMLRPFINDTLSKIGVTNQVLAEKSIRDKEQQLSFDYQQIFPLVQEEKWEEALTLVQALENQVKLLENPNTSSARPPQYPKSIQQVDQGIAATLFDLLASTPVAVSDLGPIKRDLYNKRLVLRSLLPEYYSPNRKSYLNATASIQEKKWKNADKSLQEVYLPIALADDARRKRNVLEKLIKAGLDSNS